MEYINSQIFFFFFFEARLSSRFVPHGKCNETSTTASPKQWKAAHRRSRCRYSANAAEKKAKRLPNSRRLYVWVRASKGHQQNLGYGSRLERVRHAFRRRSPPVDPRTSSRLQAEIQEHTWEIEPRYDKWNLRLLDMVALAYPVEDLCAKKNL